MKKPKSLRDELNELLEAKKKKTTYKVLYVRISNDAHKAITARLKSDKVSQKEFFLAAINSYMGTNFLK